MQLQLPQRDGLPSIPSHTLDAIVRQAQKSHPHDYSTQEYVIRTQVAAFLKIESLKSEPEYSI